MATTIFTEAIIIFLAHTWSICEKYATHIRIGIVVVTMVADVELRTYCFILKNKNSRVIDRLKYPISYQVKMQDISLFNTQFAAYEPS